MIKQTQVSVYIWGNFPNNIPVEACVVSEAVLTFEFYLRITFSIDFTKFAERFENWMDLCQWT